MKKNINQKILVEIIIKYGPSFQYYLPDSYQKFNEDLYKKGYPLSFGEMSYINSNNQKIIIKSKNDFIALLRYARNSPYKIKLFYEKELIDSFINDFKFIDIQNVYSDLDIDESNLDFQMEYNNLTFNTCNTINEIVEDIDKGALFKGIKILSLLFKKKCFHKINCNNGISNNKKIDLNKIPRNELTKSIKLEYNLPSIESLLNNFKIDLLKNDNNNFLDKLSSQFEKIDDNLHKNFIFQTMVKASKISKIKNNKNNNDISKINDNLLNNPNFQTQIIKSPINENLGIACKNCHIMPIKNKRFKCPKCLNYNLCEKCEEKNAINHFHPHQDFILIRISEKNFSDIPYSYQCLTKNLTFDIKKENIKNNEIIINNILLKNNFILPWPGSNNTILKCDKELSTIFCEKVFLPNIVIGKTVNVNLIFKKSNNIPKGEYKSVINFYVYSEKYGNTLELFINIL